MHTPRENMRNQATFELALCAHPSIAHDTQEPAVFIQPLATLIEQRLGEWQNLQSVF